MLLENIIQQVMDKLIQTKEFKTGVDPESSIKEISDWVSSHGKFKISNIFISMFGPLNILKKSKDYGLVLNTPKLGWKNFNVVK